MISYCLNCQKNTEYKKHKSKNFKTSNNKIMLLLKCAICGSKKSKFIKKQETSGILHSLGLKTSLSKIQLFVDILFWIWMK